MWWRASRPNMTFTVDWEVNPKNQSVLRQTFNQWSSQTKCVSVIFFLYIFFKQFCRYRIPGCQPPKQFSQSECHSWYSGRKKKEEKNEERRPCLPHKPKHSNWAKDRLIPNKTSKWVMACYHWPRQISGAIKHGRLQTFECCIVVIRSKAREESGGAGSSARNLHGVWSQANYAPSYASNQPSLNCWPRILPMHVNLYQAYSPNEGLTAEQYICAKKCNLFFPKQ